MPTLWRRLSEAGKRIVADPFAPHIKFLLRAGTLEEIVDKKDRVLQRVGYSTDPKNLEEAAQGIHLPFTKPHPARLLIEYIALMFIAKGCPYEKAFSLANMPTTDEARRIACADKAFGVMSLKSVVKDMTGTQKGTFFETVDKARQGLVGEDTVAKAYADLTSPSDKKAEVVLNSPALECN